MTRTLHALAIVAMALCTASAGAQVFRCGDASVYTDKPCDGATSVDVRANLLDAGPRGVPALPAEQPRPLIILPDPSRMGAGPARAASVWEYRDRQEAEHVRRTGPFR